MFNNFSRCCNLLNTFNFCVKNGIHTCTMPDGGSQKYDIFTAYTDYARCNFLKFLTASASLQISSHFDSLTISPNSATRCLNVMNQNINVTSD